MLLNYTMDIFYFFITQTISNAIGFKFSNSSSSSNVCFVASNLEKMAHLSNKLVLKFCV